jgi:CRP/FNR family transcriptional regulator
LWWFKNESLESRKADMTIENQFASPRLNKESPCLDCIARNSGFCGTIIGESSRLSPSRQERILRTFLNAAEHGTLSPQGNASQEMFVLCTGWAFRFYQLADGRRQILSILIPGDLFSAFALFDPRPGYSIQALTDVRFCQLDRADLKRELTADPSIFDALGKICAVEIDDLNAASADLGQGSAEERIVHFALRLAKRLSARGMTIRENCYSFPLSDAYVADITGLTEAEVGLTIAGLRRNDVIDISDGKLLILNPAGFESNSSP